MREIGFADYDLKKFHRLKMLMECMTNEHSETRPSTDNRRPITPAILQKFFAVLPAHRGDNLVVRAAFAVATFGLLRPGEFALSRGSALLQFRHVTLSVVPKS